MVRIGTVELVGGGGEPVDFRRTLASHGVASLAPNRLDEERWTLERTVAAGAGVWTVRVGQVDATHAVIETPEPPRDPATAAELVGVATHLLRLDEDLSAFYGLAATDPALAWVTTGAGRMLRGEGVFEDVVKTICTTNCSWSATVRMTEAIVNGLGAPGADGRRAFPTPAAMAEAGEAFYREVARAGYRAGALHRLATAVAEGRLDLERLRDPGLPDAEVERRLLDLPGVGPYAASHVMLTSLGRYGRLVLDSWTRPTYARLTGRSATDRAIERRFRRYRGYAGLAFWLFLTEGWVVSDPERPPAPAG